jgi:hypothetical protein
MVQAARRHDTGALGPRPPSSAPARLAPTWTTAGAVVAAAVAVVEVTGRELPRGSAALLVVALTVAAMVGAATARDRPVLAAAVTAGTSVLIVAYGVVLPWMVAAAAGVTGFFLVRSVPDRLAAGVVAVYALVAVAASESGRPGSTVAAAVAATAAAGLGGHCGGGSTPPGSRRPPTTPSARSWSTCRWRSGPASPASCTTSSPTTSR